MLGMCRVKDSYGIRKLGSEVFDPLVASRLQLSYEHAPVEEISVYYNARDPSVKPGVSNRCQPEETAPNTGIANTTFDLEESASGVGRCCPHRFGYAFGEIMAKRHSPAVKFDPPSLYHPRTIDDPLAMIELFSLDELCKDRKPICIAALHDFTPTKPLVEASSPDKEWQLPPH